MRCSNCSELVSVCSQCGGELDEGDEIICIEEFLIRFHFCGDACFMAWLLVNYQYDGAYVINSEKGENE